MDNNEEEFDICKILYELYPNISFQYVEDMDDAIVGVMGNRLVYSKNAILEILCEDMKLEEAENYYKSIKNENKGDRSPLFINDDLLNYIKYDEDIEFEIINVGEDSSNIVIPTNPIIPITFSVN